MPPWFELAGESLKRCEQCGYDFVLAKKRSVANVGATGYKRVRTAVLETDPDLLPETVPEVTQMIRKLRKKVAEQTRKKSNKRYTKKEEVMDHNHD